MTQGNPTSYSRRLEDGTIPSSFDYNLFLPQSLLEKSLPTQQLQLPPPSSLVSSNVPYPSGFWAGLLPSPLAMAHSGLATTVSAAAFTSSGGQADGQASGIRSGLQMSTSQQVQAQLTPLPPATQRQIWAPSNGPFVASTPPWTTPHLGLESGLFGLSFAGPSLLPPAEVCVRRPGLGVSLPGDFCALASMTTSLYGTEEEEAEGLDGIRLGQTGSQRRGRIGLAPGHCCYGDSSSEEIDDTEDGLSTASRCPSNQVYGLHDEPILETNPVDMPIANKSPGQPATKASISPNSATSPTPFSVLPFRGVGNSDAECALEAMKRIRPNQPASE
ncbi:unnamed protein product [Protopolystoma xenopodis]|uniref:Uncharacterized protein n=1 Tax=Protopolystoma xenopodis TaxID=117903 RepID=A0A3S4ZF44_9PLAT|nr:unnamed protein product [Protopolystoma xenopodis]